MIITVMGLPGSGKTTFVKKLAFQTDSLARFEPTNDIEYLKATHTKEFNDIILARLATIDCGLGDQPTVRDSDYFTSLYTFGGNYDLIQSGLAPIADKLIFLQISPEQQYQNILNRGRLSAPEELQYCAHFWHEQIYAAFEKHPTKDKKVLYWDYYRS